MADVDELDDWIGGLGYLWADRTEFYRPVAPCAFRISEIAAFEQIPAAPRFGDVPIVRVVLRNGHIWIAMHLRRIEPPDLTRVAGVGGGEADPFRARVDVVDDPRPGRGGAPPRLTKGRR